MDGNNNPAGMNGNGSQAGPGGYGTPSGMNGSGYGSPYAYQPEKKDGNTLGTVSLICGVLALLLFCTCINVPLAVMSIILGVVQLAGYKEKLTAGLGIAMSVASLVLMMIAVTVFLNVSVNTGSMMENPGSYEEYFEQYFNNRDGSF